MGNKEEQQSPTEFLWSVLLYICSQTMEQEPNGDEILEINVSGKAFIQCQRATLCQVPDSLLCSMFSSRWGGAKDSEGRIFLDHDPELFEVIVNHLRFKRTEDPSNPIPLPEIPKSKVAHFCHLLEYFGLEASFYNVLSSTAFQDFSAVEVVQIGNEKDTFSHSLLNDGKQIEMASTASGWHFAACKPALSTNQGKCWWKVTIESMPDGCDIHLGISNCHNFGVGESDTFAVCANGHGLKGGKDLGDYFPQFNQGDCFHFCFDERKMLTVLDVDTGSAWSLGPIHCKPHITVALRRKGTKVVLSPMGFEERLAMAKKIALAPLP